MLPQICQWYLKDFEIDLSGKKKYESSLSSSFVNDNSLLLLGNKLVGSNGTLSPKQLIYVLKTHLTYDIF